MPAGGCYLDETQAADSSLTFCTGHFSCYITQEMVFLIVVNMGEDFNALVKFCEAKL